jgi:hypothetical protein
VANRRRCRAKLSAAVSHFCPHATELPAAYREVWMISPGNHHSDVPTKALMQMLLALPRPEIRALAITSYLEGLARRGLILTGPLR